MDIIKKKLITLGDEADANDVVLLFNEMFSIFGGQCISLLPVRCVRGLLAPAG